LLLDHPVLDKFGFLQYFDLHRGSPTPARGLPDNRSSAREDRMKNLFSDLRYAARLLFRSPGFTIVAIGVLSIGIASGITIFSVVNAVLLRPLPYLEPDRLVLVRESLPKLYEVEGGVSAAEYWDYKRDNDVFSDIAAFTTVDLNLTGEGDARRIKVARVSPAIFSLLGIPPLTGRTFSEDEDSHQRSAVALISERLWRGRFGATTDIAGRTIRLDEKPYPIIGVMPARFRFPATDDTFSEAVDLWVPLAMSDQEKARRADSFDYGVIGRLKPGMTLEQAQSDVDNIAERMQQEHPDTYQGNVVVEAHAVRLTRQMVRRVQPILLVLLGAVFLVLLVGCANVANLLLARSQSRLKEMAVRTALGATTRRLVRQLMTESLLLAVAGGSLGLMLAWWFIALIVRFGPTNIPRLSEVNIDTWVLIFALGVSVLTGLIFGLAPAIQGASFNLNESLKESGGRASGARKSNRMRSALVVFETASAVLLLIGAGLLIDSFIRLMNVPPGFKPEGVVVARMSVPAARYPNVNAGKAMYKRVLEEIGSLHGIESASVASNLPLADNWLIGFRLEGEDETTYHTAASTWVSNDYFTAMGISVVEGRGFTEEDRESSNPVVMINRSFARKFWPEEDPIGKRVRWGGWTAGWLTVVGVAGDVKVASLEAEAEPVLYMPIFQVNRTRRDVVFVARTAGDPSNLVASIRERIRAVDAELPVYEVRTMNDVIAESTEQRRFALLTISVFAGIALLLASVGLYAVMSNLVGQRRREIGIRMALGARRVDVVRMVVVRGALLSAGGVVCGIASAFALTRTMQSLLFEVSVTEPAVFVAVPLFLIAVAVSACWVPARRAAKVDPMVALRYE
jgi:predicted permease